MQYCILLATDKAKGLEVTLSAQNPEKIASFSSAKRLLIKRPL